MPRISSFPIATTSLATSLAISLIACLSGTSALSAQTYTDPAYFWPRPFIVIDPRALEASDDIVLNGQPVQILDRGYRPSPAPSIPREQTTAPAMAAEAAGAPSAPAPRTASRTIQSRIILDAPGEDSATAGKKTASASGKFMIRSILKIDNPIKYGEWFWDDKDVPPGPVVMTVDLDARVLSVFRAGHEIGAAAVLVGTRSHPTPLGTFPILTKERDNVSEKYDNAPMPFTLRLTWDGIAIHGSPVENGYASHGCVGAPDAFAEKLFAIARIGDKVIITRGKKAHLGDTLL